MKSATHSEGPAPAVELLRKMLKAQEKENYDEFVSMGSPCFQEKLKKSVFYRACEALSAPLSGGYRLEFMIELKQETRQLYVWKLTFADGSGQALVQLWVTPEGKVAGILCNPGRVPDVQVAAA